MTGQLPDKEQKAYSVAQAQSNAKKLLGGVAKTLGQSMIQYGDLMKDIVINHITIPEVDELTSKALKLKYKTFLLENKTVGGRRVNKKIKFDETLIGKKMTKEQIKERNLKLLSEVGWPDNKEHLYFINPELFAKFKYLTRIDIDEMFTKNAEFMQPMLTNLYGMLRADPLIEAEGLLRKLLYSYFQSEGDELIKKQIPGQVIGQPEQPQEQGGEVFGKMGQNKQLATAVGSMV